jgi:hypothetical protein
MSWACGSCGDDAIPAQHSGATSTAAASACQASSNRPQGWAPLARGRATVASAQRPANVFFICLQPFAKTLNLKPQAFAVLAFHLVFLMPFAEHVLQGDVVKATKKTWRTRQVFIFLLFLLCRHGHCRKRSGKVLRLYKG